MASPKTYTLDAVKQHNTPDDLWIVIDGKVYDVTKFRNEHPGGEETLDEVAGRDATREFVDVGHSQEARQMLTKYYIGDVEGGSKLSVSTPPLPPQVPPTPALSQSPPQSTIDTTEMTSTATAGKAVLPPEKQCCALA
ncbi:uncharacterized protein LOC128859203 isoform X1 [Anastrepha ludens]|uniref:uncharacterized protein LOC128859203 isoform X1 n=1 Tax=Anastrepha ludens TaxID=28586 RepID=UPI0023AF1CD6|nr:uncharacterized protein LOC128859203 isoform X1 [Anastrepha ludens]